VRSDRLLCLACGVGGWGELVEALDGAVGESGQNRGQVFANRQPDSAAALDDGEDRSHLGTSFLAAKVDPVTATDGDSTDILPISVMN